MSRFGLAQYCMRRWLSQCSDDDVNGDTVTYRPHSGTGRSDTLNDAVGSGTNRLQRHGFAVMP